jgi:hypothetical protein
MSQLDEDKKAAIACIKSAKDDAINVITTDKDAAVHSITTDKDTALSGIKSAKEDAISVITTDKDTALTGIKSAKEDAINAITTSKGEALVGINKAREDALKRIDSAQRCFGLTVCIVLLLAVAAIVYVVLPIKCASTNPTTWKQVVITVIPQIILGVICIALLITTRRDDA